MDAAARENGAFERLYAKVARHEAAFIKMDGVRHLVPPLIIPPLSEADLLDEHDWVDADDSDDEIDVETIPGEVPKMAAGHGEEEEEEKKKLRAIMGECSRSPWYVGDLRS